MFANKWPIKDVKISVLVTQSPEPFSTIPQLPTKLVFVRITLLLIKQVNFLQQIRHTGT